MSKQAARSLRGDEAQGVMEAKGCSAEDTDVKHNNYVLVALTLDSSIGLFVPFAAVCPISVQRPTII